MIVGVGIDIIEVKRIKRACCSLRFLQRVFTEEEQKYFEKCGNNPQTISGNFAAKEAVMKALGTGFDVGWKNIEILHCPNGKPYVNLYDRAAYRLSCIGGKKVWVSISHIRGLAVAQAIIEGEDEAYVCCNSV
ncbi:holo-[acyl-carrier-protein] synthase [Caldicoprobacter guelmensis]|uniref:holo-ACP synthase n=1 Tax=Caldicoprobacter guelmensis TaxID=1170224 RepID=UPI0019577330|nr:holo-[acyl-carrier-protein] synthase [Caldicoprobacter guelmensis]